MSEAAIFHATTIIAVRRNEQLVFCGDGQVSLGQTIMKGHAVKVRSLLDGQILTGFAGATADAFTLFEKFEAKLKAYNQNLIRAAVELAKDWRTDRYLRRLEALLLVGDDKHTLLVSGTGDVIEPDGDIIAIGSGGNYATAAAKALRKHTDLSAYEIATEAIQVASEIDIYTNDNLVVEVLNYGDGTTAVTEGAS
ncbi:MAG: ATP-dependent protease subunit HslV [Bradymonadia bacterium]